MPSTPEPIGLIAAWGNYPLRIARSLKERGHRVIGIGLRQHADESLRGLCDEYLEGSMTRFGDATAFLNSHGVKKAVLAGKVHKVNFFDGFNWWTDLPDWKTVRLFFPHFFSGTKDRKDDTLLLVVVEAFREDGIELVPATDYAPDLLVEPGLLTPTGLSESEERDVAFGWILAKEMGKLDVGQSVCIKGQAVLAVEAVEGTDACIERAGGLSKQGAFTVVKVAKPQQDMRFDVPTVGPGTIQSLIQAKARVLAIEAGRTILLDPDEVIRLATEHGISIVARLDQAIANRAAA